MPSAPLSPAAGNAVIASGQTRLRKNVILWFPFFGPDGNTPDDRASRELRARTTVNVRNTPNIYFSLFHYATYNDGVTNWLARPNVEWRPVGQVRQDDVPEVAGVSTAEWLPLSAPMILPVGLPINFQLDAGGLEFVAVEFRVSTVDLPPFGRDRVIVTITSSA